MKLQTNTLTASLLSMALIGCGGSGDNTPQEIVDTSSPVITLIGESSITLTLGDIFIDPGTKVTDNVDTSLVADAVGIVNTSTVGTYTVTYTATDAAGNESTATRTITFAEATDTEVPVITLLGDATMNLTVGDTYTESGSSVKDNLDIDLVAGISGTVDTSTVGTYTLTYTVADTAGNQSTANRTVIVGDAPIGGDAYIFQSTNDDSYYFEYWGDTWGLV